MSRLRLGVNIDHVATVRNARGEAYPSPARAADLAIQAGADGITAHLREDRRHISDDDIVALAKLTRQRGRPLNFEMAVTPEMRAIALHHRPHAACLVPERREEVTTEGGLDVIGGHNRVAPLVADLTAAGIRASLFIDPDRDQIAAAHRVGAPVIELHTGAYCTAAREGADSAGDLLRTLRDAAAYATEPRPGGPRRPRHRLRDRGRHCRDSGLPRAQHRPLPDRRVDLRRPRRHSHADARADGRGARDRRRDVAA